MLFDPGVHRARRERLMRRMGPRSVAIVRPAPEARRNGDSNYLYRQSSDLLYLTGFPEPKATLVLRPGAGDERSLLFVRPRDAEQEMWSGRRAGPEGAVRDHGLDAAYPIDELERRLPELLAGADELHYAVGQDPGFDERLLGQLARMRLTERRTGRPPCRIVDPSASLHEERLRKEPGEIEALGRAIAITAEGHLAARRAARPGATERELQAALEGTFLARGASGPGYPSIVATGASATVMHYVDNRAVLAQGQLVLIDAGAEVDGYTADVTRTFPVSGRFSELQRRCYDVVLRAQEEAIRLVAPGVTLDRIHDRTVELLTEGMVELGLLEGPAAARITDGSSKRYYPHRTSHWLGLDVHDAGTYLDGEGRARPLEPGMVITIEPGLYVPADDDRAPAALRGTGVRIEDDLLVTDDGHRNLTAAIPKQAEEMES